MSLSNRHAFLVEEMLSAMQTALFDANVINLCVDSPIQTKISFISMLQKWSKAAGRRVRSACMSLVKRMVDK